MSLIIINDSVVDDNENKYYYITLLKITKEKGNIIKVKVNNDRARSFTK